MAVGYDDGGVELAVTNEAIGWLGEADNEAVVGWAKEAGGCACMLLSREEAIACCFCCAACCC